MPSPSPKFWNFKSVQKRLKFCGQLLKAPKVKDNEVNQNWTKVECYTMKFCEILLTFVKSHNLFIHVFVKATLIKHKWKDLLTFFRYNVKAESVKANGREPKSCLDRVFNFRLGRFDFTPIQNCVDARPLLELKTRPRSHPPSLNIATSVALMLGIRSLL